MGNFVNKSSVKFPSLRLLKSGCRHLVLSNLNYWDFLVHGYSNTFYSWSVASIIMKDVHIFFICWYGHFCTECKIVLFYLVQKISSQLVFVGDKEKTLQPSVLWSNLDANKTGFEVAHFAHILVMIRHHCSSYKNDTKTVSDPFLFGFGNFQVRISWNIILALGNRIATIIR